MLCCQNKLQSGIKVTIVFSGAAKDLNTSELNDQSPFQINLSYYERKNLIVGQRKGPEKGKV